jgi:hypothetical protein
MSQKAMSDLEKGLNGVTSADIRGLVKAEQSYGDSWKKRGGVGAFMMLARKWDRLENHVKKYNYDIFQAIHADLRSEGIIDDIRDLRRYLLLVENHVNDKSIPQLDKEGEANSGYTNQDR